MIPLLAAMLLPKFDGIPAEFEAVYEGDAGDVMVLVSRLYFQMMKGDKHIVAGIDLGVRGDFDGGSSGGFNQAPDGDFVAGWVASRRMSIWGDSDYSRFGIRTSPSTAPYLYQYGLSMESQHRDSWKPALESIVPRAEAPSDHGTVRVSYGKADGNGRISMLRVQMFGESGNAKMNELFWPILSLDKLSVEGKWKSGPLQFDLKDEGGRVGDVTGTVTYNGVDHLIKGRRFGSRCAFGVLGIHSGLPEGVGYVEWCPSDARARKIRDRDEDATDHIDAFLSLPADLPNGMEKMMDRG